MFPRQTNSSFIDLKIEITQEYFNRKKLHILDDLIIWKKSMKLAKVIYTLTDTFPKDERFGIISQMRRASVSIASNIAEGAGRESKKEFLNFLSIASGSSYELETQLFVSEDLGYITEEKCKETRSLLEEIQKMNYVFRKKLYDIN
jgi:four helix bundle protein